MDTVAESIRFGLDVENEQADEGRDGRTCLKLGGVGEDWEHALDLFS